MRSSDRLVASRERKVGLGNAFLPLFLFCAFWLLSFLTGCAARPDVYQPHHREVAGEIWGPHTVGQTFVARAPGLYRIDVFLATYARQNSGPVVFHLRRSPASDQDLVTISLDAAEVEDNAYRSFTFPPLADSAGQSYYFFLEAPAAQPGNAVTVWYNPTDAYGGGTAVLNGLPRPGDLHFRTYVRYSAGQMLRDALQGLARHWTTALLALLLFLTPGYALLTLVAPPIAPDLPQRLILSAGLSVALAPLFFLFAALVGLRLGPELVALVVGVATAYCALRVAYCVFRHARIRNTQPAMRNLQSPVSSLQSPSSILPLSLLLLIATLSLTVRLLLVQDLAAPMWGDSYHHTLIAQLLVDHGGLFTSWEPYAPLRTFTYHYGFHSLVALFHWLTGTSVLASVIVVGQLLNALAPLLAYPLVLRLGGGPWAGVLAVLLASLWSSMPMGYVNWGRYTQLTGMVLLPVAAALTVDVLEAEGWRWRRGLSAAIAVAGLVLSHYLVTFMYGVFVLACLGRWTYAAWRRSYAPWKPWLRIGGVGLMTGILLLPWLVRLWSGVLPQMLAARVTGRPQTAYFRTAYNVASEFLTYIPAHLLILAGLGIGLGLLRRRWGTAVMAGWVSLLVLLANPHLVGLPGTGVVNNFAVFIALYLPLSVLGGFGLGEMVGWSLDKPFHRLRTRLGTAPNGWMAKWLRDWAAGGQMVVAAAVLIAALVGAGQRFGDLDYRYRLVTAGDLRAMRWIRENTPADAKFLVNGLFAFGGRTVVGSDAGWWIPYLAERRNTVPPVVYTMERRSQPGYVARVENLYRQLTAHPLDSPQALQLLASEGVTHVYIGVAGGELLDPRVLARSPHYRLVYQADGVWIFRVDIE
jgi:hypothetical protein